MKDHTQTHAYTHRLTLLLLLLDLHQISQLALQSLLACLSFLKLGLEICVHDKATIRMTMGYQRTQMQVQKENVTRHNSNAANDDYDGTTQSMLVHECRSVVTLLKQRR